MFHVVGDPTIHQGRLFECIFNHDEVVEQEIKFGKNKTKTNLGRWVGWSIGYAITDLTKKSRTLASGHSR